MQKANCFFVGVDVSKLYFDCAIMRVIDHIPGAVLSHRFENNVSGTKAFGKWLKAQGYVHGGEGMEVLVVMENTGYYHRALWAYCSEHNLPIHIGNAAHILWSFGIARGKSDEVDAARLCRYAYKHADELKATPPLNKAVLLLKDLHTFRRGLLTQLTANRVRLQEIKTVSDAKTQKMLEDICKKAVEGLEASLKLIEKKMSEIIAANPDIKLNYDRLLTVPGIGRVTAIYLICATSNFASQPTGKQLACFAGVAPFEHTSGSSVRGKTKVSKMGDKDLKRLLHQGARSVVLNNKEMRDYYNRKKAEGKHDLAVINAVRNKILLRAATVVNKGKDYVEKTGKVTGEKTEKNNEKCLVES